MIKRPSTKPKTKPKPRPQPARRSPAAVHAGGPLRITWSGFRPMFDFWGNEIKRFYQLETLASATEWMLQKGDRFLFPSIQEILGPAPVTRLSFELFQEGRFQIIFRLRAFNAKRKEASFALVAAKGPDDFSAVAAAEHKNLWLLHERAPESVVRPFRGGKVFLPDRHGRLDHGREVYVYLTQWLTGYHELGIAKNLQFFVNVKTPHLFSIAQTEGIKGKIIEILARTYDPAKRECMEPPQVASGDFVVTWPKAGAVPNVKLIACRRLQRNVAPGKFIANILNASWDWGGRSFQLAPEDPAVFFGALVRAAGRDMAETWVRQYRTGMNRGALREQDYFTPDVVKELGLGAG